MQLSRAIILQFQQRDYSLDACRNALYLETPVTRRQSVAFAVVWGAGAARHGIGVADDGEKQEAKQEANFRAAVGGARGLLPRFITTAFGRRRAASAAHCVANWEGAHKRHGEESRRELSCEKVPVGRRDDVARAVLRTGAVRLARQIRGR